MRWLGTVVALILAVGASLWWIGRHHPGGIAAADGWTYEEPVDKVTGKATYDATREFRLDGGGTAEMTAECSTEGSAIMAVTYLRVKIAFFDAGGKPVEVDTGGFDENGGGQLRYSTTAGSEDTIMAQLTHRNEATLVAAASGVDTPLADGSGIGALTGALVKAFTPSSLDNATAFANASVARVEVPLLNGSKPVIDLKPQDPDLRKVLGRCVPSAMQKPAPAAPAKSAENATPAAPPSQQAQTTGATASQSPSGMEIVVLDPITLESWIGDTILLRSRSPTPIIIKSVVVNGKRGVYGCDHRAAMNGTTGKPVDDFEFMPTTVQNGEALGVGYSYICGSSIVSVTVETDRGTYELTPQRS